MNIKLLNSIHYTNKLHYITTLQPQTINKITGTISDLHDGPMFQDTTITIISAEDDKQIVITITSGGNVRTITLSSTSALAGSASSPTAIDSNTMACSFSGDGSVSQVATAIGAAITLIELKLAELEYPPLDISVEIVTNVISFTTGELVDHINFGGNYNLRNKVEGNNILKFY